MCLAAGLPAASGFVHDPPVSDPTPTSLKEPGEPDPADSSSESHLIEEARQGSSRAADALFERYRSWLRKRVRGRLPPWARGSLDTSDLVQDALHHTFARLNGFKSESRQRAAGLPSARRREPDPRRDAPGDPTSPRSSRRSNRFGHPRMARPSFSNSGTTRPGGGKGTDNIRVESRGGA